MPKWWRPSLPLNVSEADAERIAAKLDDAVQHAPEKEEPSESPPKRFRIHHCAEVKDWFLDLVAIDFGSAAFGEQAAREVGVWVCPRQHVRGTASGHWSDETLQGRAGSDP